MNKHPPPPISLHVMLLYVPMNEVSTRWLTTDSASHCYAEGERKTFSSSLILMQLCTYIYTCRDSNEAFIGLVWSFVCINGGLINVTEYTVYVSTKNIAIENQNSQ